MNLEVDTLAIRSYPVSYCGYRGCHRTTKVGAYTPASADAIRSYPVSDVHAYTVTIVTATGRQKYSSQRKRRPNNS